MKERTEHLLRTSKSALRSIDVEQLKLPRIGNSIKADNEKGNCWQYQTYEEFARKTDKMNRDVMFNKKLMDDSFQKAVSLVIAKGTRTSGARAPKNISGINQMLSRVSDGEPS